MPGERDRPPFFSVVIPTFNRPHLIGRAIRSVLSQQFAGFEMIISDDGSTLSYAQVLEPFLADPRVRVVQSPCNKGAAAARNLGIAQARGAFVAFLDDDDEFLSTFLQMTHDTLEQAAEENAKISFCGVHWLNDSAHSSTILPRRTLEFDAIYPTELALLETFMSIGTGYGVCVCAQTLRDIGGFNEALFTVEDTELFLKVIDRGFRPTVVPGVHVLVHDHDGDRLTSQDMFATNIAEIKKLLAAFGPVFTRYPTLERQLLNHKTYLEQLVAEQGNSAAGGRMA